jgi:3'-phosphoadenosine 5'-phosphosulfate sulfotransferase (PAPS reductase)/FAD synthetase
MSKKIAWFSCGITSAVACKLAIEEYGKENVELVYIKIDSAHPDNDRFIKECENWYGKEITVIRNEKYKDQFDVIKHIKYVNGVAGAPCTLHLKKNVRFKFEKEFEYDGQIFGFEFVKKEINRAIRFAEQYPHTKPLYPLIDAKLTKEMCADIILKNGIKLPTMYELGFHNNNCIGCVKGGKGYWNHIKKHFPETFDKMAKAEREVGATCIKNKYLDELKENEGRHEPPITPNCGTFCEIEFADIIDDRTEEVLTGLTKINQLSLF